MGFPLCYSICGKKGNSKARIAFVANEPGLKRQGGGRELLFLKSKVIPATVGEAQALARAKPEREIQIRPPQAVRRSSREVWGTHNERSIGEGEDLAWMKV